METNGGQFENFPDFNIFRFSRFSHFKHLSRSFRAVFEHKLSLVSERLTAVGQTSYASALHHLE